MSLLLCPIQELCRHYTNGTKRKVHHIRISDPCNRWVAMDCSQIGILAQLQEYATGEVMACSLEKVRRLKRKLKE